MWVNTFFATPLFAVKKPIGTTMAPFPFLFSKFNTYCINKPEFVSPIAF